MLGVLLLSLCLVYLLSSILVYLLSSILVYLLSSLLVYLTFQHTGGVLTFQHTGSTPSRWTAVEQDAVFLRASGSSSPVSSCYELMLDTAAAAQCCPVRLREKISQPTDRKTNLETFHGYGFIIPPVRWLMCRGLKQVNHNCSVCHWLMLGHQIVVFNKFMRNSTNNNKVPSFQCLNGEGTTDDTWNQPKLDQYIQKSLKMHRIYVSMYASMHIWMSACIGSFQ